MGIGDSGEELNLVPAELYRLARSMVVVRPATDVVTRSLSRRHRCDRWARWPWPRAAVSMSVSTGNLRRLCRALPLGACSGIAAVRLSPLGSIHSTGGADALILTRSNRREIAAEAQSYLEAPKRHRLLSKRAVRHTSLPVRCLRSG